MVYKVYIYIYVYIYMYIYMYIYIYVYMVYAYVKLDSLKKLVMFSLLLFRVDRGPGTL